MIKAIIFDLDDTLYDEKQFVDGGFKAVSQHLSSADHIPYSKVYRLLWKTLRENGRGIIFDSVLKDLDLYNKTKVKKLIRIYRAHLPNLVLYPEVMKVLISLKIKNYKLGLITDGNVYVQRRKVKVLGIEKFFQAMVFSNIYGPGKQKPCRFPYEKVLQRISTAARNSIYIGDNPYKDFITAKKLGMHTIRVGRGQYEDIKLSQEHEADFNVRSLSGILNIIKKLEVAI